MRKHIRYFLTMSLSLFSHPSDRYDYKALALKPASDTAERMVSAGRSVAHTREPLAKITANVHLVIQITRPQRRGQRVKTHEYDVHGVVLLVFIYSAAPTQIHAEPVRNNSYPRSQVRYRVLPAGIA